MQNLTSIAAVIFDGGPVMYGLVIFAGLWHMFYNLCHLKLMNFALEAGVFALVFYLHGGTMAGGFAATIAALLAGWIFPLHLKT